MATDGPTPPPCDPKLFKEGVYVGGPYATAGACAFEALVKEVAELTGVPVDWHYMGGRAMVICYQRDFERVQVELANTLKPKLQQQLEEMYPEIYRQHHGLAI